MHNDYFSPQALLAEETLVPCTFQYAVATMGRALEPTCMSSELPANSQVDLPLWLGKALFERNIADLQAPQVYGERMRLRVEADASVIRLRQAPYFYTVGLTLASLTQDLELGHFIRKTFADRYQHLLSDSLRAQDGRALQQVLVKLNEEEKQMYEAGREGASRQEQWWAAGGRAPMMVAACKGAAAAGGAMKRKRPTEAANDKENVGQR